MCSQFVAEVTQGEYSLVGYILQKFAFVRCPQASLIYKEVITWEDKKEYGQHSAFWLKECPGTDGSGGRNKTILTDRVGLREKVSHNRRSKEVGDRKRSQNPRGKAKKENRTKEGLCLDKREAAKEE